MLRKAELPINETGKGENQNFSPFVLPLFILLICLPINFLIDVNPLLSAPELLIEKGVKFGNVDCDGNVDRFLAENKTINGLRLKEGSSVLQTLKARVDGNFTDKLSIRGEFDDSLYPSKRELTLRYQAGGLSVTGGDIRAGFRGVDLAMEQRTLFGARMAFSNDRESASRGPSITGFMAQITARQRTDEFPGDDTSGPFFLSEYPVIANSERIEVDREMKYQFTDYEIDNERGTILFKEPVERGKVIRIVYEHDREFGVARNRIWGTRVDGNSGRVGKYGVTLAGLQERRSFGNSVEDLGQRVLGMDLDLRKTPLGRFRIEAARSEDDRNDLDGDGRPDNLSGNAMNMNYSYQNRLFSMKGKYERFDPGFRTVGEGSSDSDRTLVDLKTTYSTTAALQFFVDLRQSDTNLDNDPFKARAKTSRIETRALKKGTLGGYGYELTLTGRNEVNDQTSALPSGSAKFAGTGLITENSENLVGADLKVRLRGALAGLKLETRNRSRDTAMADSISDSRSDTGEISVTARVARPLIAGLAIRADRDVNPNYVEGDGSNLTTTLTLDGKTSEKLRARAQISLRDINGVQGGRDTSASLNVKAGGGVGLSADATYEVKRSSPDGGDVTGTSVLGFGLNFVPGSGTELRAFFERRGVDGLTSEDRSEYGFRAMVHPRENLSIKGEIRSAELLDHEIADDGYEANTAYLEAALSF
ncbi:MAG: hypothetical protein CVV64_08415 [Candidatus Wallbacteria bacterium HGW-Wallbacteria-1]|jgi:hypothetical protein|uniref:Uncharacterized protein n=1 Tax=Candidatus Wallbacteria bacterium HGW-Wallbacteria-1 TaxID=2013854 RepID=A0A2N1PPV9_9BACT|nr:MAG: hypothetical protein CVV64_08415 [Candidatus Wallbacteria bacterium HGW-Wallbacteria-1]